MSSPNLEPHHHYLITIDISKSKAYTPTLSRRFKKNNSNKKAHSTQWPERRLSPYLEPRDNRVVQLLTSSSMTRRSRMSGLYELSPETFPKSLPKGLRQRALRLCRYVDCGGHVPQGEHDP